MYRFALRPWWLLSHLFVVALVVVMVNLGFWQLRRLDERRDRNDLIAARSAEPVVDVRALLAASPDDVRFRPATASGTYLDQSVIVDNRSLDGAPGAWVLTPLELESGEVVMVNRGFTPFGEGNAIAAPAPPSQVTVTGILETEVDRRCPTAPADEPGFAGRRYACVDLDAMGDDLGLDVALVELRLAASTPEEGAGAPTPVPPPELGEGPHFAYAVQWFIFSAIAIAGYPLILRRAARQRAVEARSVG